MSGDANPAPRRWSPFSLLDSAAGSSPVPRDITIDAPLSQQPPTASTSSAQQTPAKKVRVHKVRTKRPDRDQFINEMLDRRIAEIVPGLADLSVADAERTATTATQLRQAFDQKYAAIAKEHRVQAKIYAESNELKNIFDFTLPHPVDAEAPPEDYVRKHRAVPRSVRLSWYQQNMVQYMRFLQAKNIWYYRDRMNVARGPCPAHVLRECWVHGVIDENTLVWGQGLFDWLPVKNVQLLIPTIRTFEVQLGAWLKKTLSLKPALNFIRKERSSHRNPETFSSQVDRMY